MLSLIFASTVLVIGDSHMVGPFGWNLDEALRNQGHQVATYGSCGSVAGWWYSGKKTTCGFYSKDLSGKVTQVNSQETPLIENLMKIIKPDSVIVELASNYVNFGNEESAIKDMKRLVKSIKDSGASCFWMTAPDMRLYRNSISRLDRLVYEAVGDDCRVFNSSEVTSYPASGGDGVHYWFKEGLPMARNWATEAARSFQN